MYCSTCGSPSEEGKSFCAFCGTALSSAPNKGGTLLADADQDISQYREVASNSSPELQDTSMANAATSVKAGPERILGLTLIILGALTALATIVLTLLGSSLFYNDFYIFTIIIILASLTLFAAGQFGSQYYQRCQSVGLLEGVSTFAIPERIAGVALIIFSIPPSLYGGFFFRYSFFAYNGTEFVFYVAAAIYFVVTLISLLAFLFAAFLFYKMSKSTGAIKGFSTVMLLLSAIALALFALSNLLGALEYPVSELWFGGIMPVRLPDAIFRVSNGLAQFSLPLFFILIGIFWFTLHNRLFPKPVLPVHQQVAMASSGSSSNTLTMVAFVFSLISTISIGWLLVPLAWMIPMTVMTWRIHKGKRQLTTTFGVCSLLFLNQVSGIVLLVEQSNRQKAVGTQQ